MTLLGQVRYMAMTRKVNASWVNVPSKFAEVRSCEDGSLQIYYYDSKEVTITYSLDKIELTQSVVVHPEIYGRKLKLVVVIVRTSKNVYQITTLYPNKTVTVSVIGYAGINNTLNNVYSEFIEINQKETKQQ